MIELETADLTIPEPSRAGCLPGSARTAKITAAGAEIRRDTCTGMPGRYLRTIAYAAGITNQPPKIMPWTVVPNPPH